MKNIFIILITCISSISFAQVNFEAKVNKDKVGLHESIMVNFEIDVKDDDFTPPSFNDFEVLSGPSTNINNIWINGKKTYKKTITYLVSPQKEGSLSIDKAITKIDNKTYYSQVLTVEVNDKYRGDNMNPVTYKFNENVHLIAEISKPKMSLDDSVTVTYKLYVSPDVGIRDWKSDEEVIYKGFTAKQINIENIKVQNGTYQGKPYRYVILKQTELQPKQKGVFNLEPFKLNVTLEVPTNKKDVFGSRVMKPVSKTLVTETLKITVN